MLKQRAAGAAHSLQALDRARRLELRRRHLTAGIEGSSLSSLVPSLTAAGGIQNARAVLDWLDATARAALPQALRAALGRSAGEAEEARSQAAACADLSGRIHLQVEELRKRFGLTGLPVEDAHRLLGQLASLIEAGAQLKDIVELADQKRRLEAAGTGSLLQQADDLRVAPGDWCTLLDAVIALRQARHARVADPALRRVSGLRLEAQGKAFVERDRRKVVHDREALRRAAPGYAIGKAAGGLHDTQPAEAERDGIPASAPGPDGPEPPPAAAPERTRFVLARVADCGIDPNPARFYEGGYRPALRRMVHHVIDAEGPVYQADMVTRSARAHGYQRNGGRIEERVLAAVGPEIPATTEDDGKVAYWPQGAGPAPLVPSRRAELHVRGPASIPLAELAGLAKELLAPGRDDAAVMERMREHCGLGKLRESTRRRLAAAIGIARAHPA